jgi:hypothetical protein
VNAPKKHPGPVRVRLSAYTTRLLVGRVFHTSATLRPQLAKKEPALPRKAIPAELSQASSTAYDP